MNFEARVRNVLPALPLLVSQKTDLRQLRFRIGLERLPLVHSERLQPRSL